MPHVPWVGGSVDMCEKQCTKHFAASTFTFVIIRHGLSPRVQASNSAHCSSSAIWEPYPSIVWSVALEVGSRETTTQHQRTDAGNASLVSVHRRTSKRTGMASRVVSSHTFPFSASKIYEHSRLASFRSLRNRSTDRNGNMTEAKAILLCRCKQYRRTQSSR